MKNPGVFAVNRAAFDHPMFKDEPFTEREAWFWLCGAAAFKAMQVRVAGVIVNLERGQLAFSQRFLQERFQWSRQRVRGFIAKLELHQSITQIPTKGVTKITICNYDKHAFGQPSEQPHSNQAATSQRPKEEELKELKELKEKKDDVGEARAPASALISKDAFDLADKIAVAAGHELGFLPPSWMSSGPPYRVQMWLSAGWSKDLILASVTEQAARKRDGPAKSIMYFEPGIASAVARQNTPLPTVKVVAGKEIEVANARSKPQSDWSSALDRLGEFARGETQGGGCGDGKVVQILLPPKQSAR